VWSRRRLVIATGTAVVAVAGIVLAVVLTGGDRSEPDNTPIVVQPGAPGESGRTLSPEELANLTVPAHNAADVEFFERMIPHHAQALEMAALVPERTTNPDIRLLAERIEISQRDEIVQMEAWLKARGLPVPAPHAHHAGHDQLMPGMLNDDQLRQLEQARGAEFDRLFLEFMIYHHQGAITMAEELYARGGGLEPESDRFAREIMADQGIEISRMQQMLARL
jgi:Uncharacterized protein conserved in bacteria